MRRSPGIWWGSYRSRPRSTHHEGGGGEIASSRWRVCWWVLSRNIIDRALSRLAKYSTTSAESLGAQEGCWRVYVHQMVACVLLQR